MTPQLWPEIEKALRDSRFFILMADPLSAQSEWVRMEVNYWLEMNGAAVREVTTQARIGIGYSGEEWQRAVRRCR